MPSPENAAGRTKSYTGSIEEIAFVLGRHLARPKSISYGKSRREAVIDRGLLELFGPLWREFRDKQDHLSFSKHCMEAGIASVAKQKMWFKKIHNSLQSARRHCAAYTCSTSAFGAGASKAHSLPWPSKKAGMAKKRQGSRSKMQGKKQIPAFLPQIPAFLPQIPAFCVFEGVFWPPKRQGSKMQGFGPKCKDFFGPKCKDFFASPKVSSKTHLRHLQACRHASTFRCAPILIKLLHTHIAHQRTILEVHNLLEAEPLAYTHCTSRDYHCSACMTSRDLRQNTLHTHIAHQRTIMQTMHLVCCCFLLCMYR